MGRLFATAIGVAAVLTGLIFVLYLLPGKDACCKNPAAKNEHCKDKDGKCEMKEIRIVKEWKDADGKMHREVTIEMSGDGPGACADGKESCPHGKMDKSCGGDQMNQSCGGHGDMRESCMHGDNTSSSGCCCCKMMQGGMMDHCEMKKDSIVLDTTVRIKIRGKI